MKEVFINLVRLQILDRGLSRLRARIDGLPDEVRERELVVESMRGAAEAMDDERRLLLSRAHRLEVDLSVDEKRIEKLEVQSRESRDIAAVKIAQHEVESLRTKVSEAQDDALACMEKAEHIAINKVVALEEIAIAGDSLRDFKAQAEQDKQDLCSELQEKETERQGVAKFINDDVLQKYNHLYEPRKGRPASRMVEGSCEGCGMAIRPNDQGKIRLSKAIVNCPACSRILVDASCWEEAVN